MIDVFVNRFVLRPFGFAQGRQNGVGDMMAAMKIEASLDTLPPLSAGEEAAYEAGLAVRALAAARVEGWVEQCVGAALHAEHPFPRGEARIALQWAPAAEVVAKMLPALTSENRRLRRRAMTLLPRLDARELVRQMEAWLPAASREGKRAACVVLAALDEAGAPLLRSLATGDDGAVARRAERALEMLADRAAGRLMATPRSASAERPFGLRPPPGGAPTRPRPRSQPFGVAAFNFSYGVNLGVLIRSAEAAGAQSLWIVGRDFYYRPATKGTDWWLPIEVLPTPRACIERARREGYQIVAIQQGPQARSLFEVDWPEKPLIVVGNEGDGLPAAFVEEADMQIEIPVAGAIDSLNVAVAASVATYFYLASRRGVGVGTGQATRSGGR